jgi:hypothetical protein
MAENGQLANGNAVDFDVMTASAKAYLSALNGLILAQHEPKIGLLAAG